MAIPAVAAAASSVTPAVGAENQDTIGIMTVRTVAG